VKILKNWLRLGFAAIALCGLVAEVTSAEQLAPAPVKAGEFYLGAGLSYGRIGGADFKAHELYPIEDGDCCWLQGSQGYLMTHSTTSDNVIMPMVHLGYAFDRAFGDGVLRLEVSGEANKRDISADRLKWTVDYPDEFAAVIPIDGQDNADGSLPDDLEGDDVVTPYGYPYFDSFWENEFDFSEKTAFGAVTLLFDTKPGKWRFSRGVGITYHYVRQEISNTYYYDPTLTADSFASYDYLMRNHLFGTKILYSAGYDLLKNTTFFTTGSMDLLAQLMKFEGNQIAPGLGNFDEYQSGTGWGTGGRNADFNDWSFVFKARLGVGASVRVLFMTITGHVEGNYTSGLPVPRDKNAHFKISSGSGLGYRGTATVDLVF